MDREHLGSAGWAGIAAGVVAFDVLAPETLTSAFRRARESENPFIRAAAIGSLAVTAAHLMGVIPENYDPFMAIGSLRRLIGKEDG